MDKVGGLPGVIGIATMLIVAGSVTAIFLMGNDSAISQTIGAILSLGGTVVGYFFGSSAGSQKKDDTLAKLAGDQSREPPA